MKKTEDCRQLDLPLGIMAKARKANGWTQLALARLVGCSESKISKIETGRATPDSALKNKIAERLKIALWAIGA